MGFWVFIVHILVVIHLVCSICTVFRNLHLFFSIILDTDHSDSWYIVLVEMYKTYLKVTYP